MRRLHTASNTQQYVYFPITNPIAIRGHDTFINPVLPGNTSTSLFGGTDSNNFMLHLGQGRISLNVEGVLTSLAASDYPGNLGTGHRYLLDDVLAGTVTVANGSPDVTSGSGTNFTNDLENGSIIGFFNPTTYPIETTTYTVSSRTATTITLTGNYTGSLTTGVKVVHFVGANARVQTADEIRHVLSKFWLDQSDIGSNYTNIQFGWPGWNSSNYTTVNSQTVKLFEGFMSKPTFIETPGQPGKIDYSFEFVVGSVA